MTYRRGVAALFPLPLATYQAPSCAHKPQRQHTRHLRLFLLLWRPAYLLHTASHTHTHFSTIPGHLHTRTHTLVPRGTAHTRHTDCVSDLLHSCVPFILQFLDMSPFVSFRLDRLPTLPAHSLSRGEKKKKKTACSACLRCAGIFGLLATTPCWTPTVHLDILFFATGHHLLCLLCRYLPRARAHPTP